MTTRLVTAAAVLVVAIVFGFVFWNQFTSNQRMLAEGNAEVSGQTVSQSQTPRNDSADNVDKDLNSINVNDIDSDSAQMNAQVQGF